ncbi:F0F1 ATP synthase subunit delta [Idiomarina tyrosinivorans]|uniref:ATP synthase subunit delta n=1 Tax=Idiomarina tyrosinivorans TaxID=1445662 RepID=A0A432ZSY3_9GAMM|nr:F0F1 ATP synthase subunit delta [Idiomarina tyrosinivorans]RUO80972.1 F0F1 ATP synthase subunit delta [Idiomarina tyrosinivorans]
MSELTTVARPYAKAAFDFAQEHKAIEQWQDMLAFAAAVAEDEHMVSFLSAANNVDKVAETFINVCGDQLDAHGANFIKVLAANGRLIALPEVKAMFDELVAQQSQQLTVDVISPAKLLKAQQTAITEALEKRFGGKVKLNCSVDKNIIGGLVIKAGDTVIDGTLRGKLERLAHALQS